MQLGMERMMTTFEVALSVDFSWIENVESTAKKIYLSS
jgi:hypothetical protein